MDAEVEAELGRIAALLKARPQGHQHDDFKSLARTTIGPALKEIADRLRSQGYDCRVLEQLDDTSSVDTEQSVCLVLDPHSGVPPMCYRLPPGESEVQMEKPLGGMHTVQRVPFIHLTKENIQHVAVDYLRHAV